MDTIYGKNTQSYLGVKALNPPDVFLAKGNPSPHKQKTIGDIWIDEKQKTLFVNLANAAGLSNWASMLVTPYVVGSGNTFGSYSNGNYSSIQAAIDQAVADKANDLSNFKLAYICVLPGQYREHITIPDACLVSGIGLTTQFGALLIGTVTFDCNFGILSNLLVFDDNSASYMIRNNPNSILPKVEAQILNCQIGEGTSPTNCIECFTNAAQVTIKITSSRLSTAAVAILSGNNTNVEAQYSNIDQSNCVSQGTSRQQYSFCNINGQLILQGTTQMALNNSMLQSGSVECLDIGAGCSVDCINTSLSSNAPSGFVTLNTGTLRAGLCPTPGSAQLVNPLTILQTIPHL